MITKEMLQDPMIASMIQYSIENSIDSIEEDAKEISRIAESIIENNKIDEVVLNRIEDIRIFCDNIERIVTNR